MSIRYLSGLTVDSTVLVVDAANDRVGIGTASPAYKLDVSSDIRIGEGLRMSPNAGALYAIDGALSYYSSTNGVYLNGAGTNGWLRLNGSGVENDSNSINIYGAGAGGYIELRTGTSTRILIQNGGNVGIGTTTPVGILHLYKAAAATRLAIDGDAGQNRLISYRTGALQRFGLYVNNTAESGSNAGSNFAIRAYSDAGTLLSTPFFINRATGNVGIGTTAPVSIGTGITTLDIQGSNAGGVAFGPSGTKNYIYGASTMYVEAHTTAVFTTSGSERMRITSAGNVGIGTTSPTSLLSVQGNTDLGNSYGNTTSSLSTTRISGFALYQDASNRYGNYGVLILNSDTGWTASARRFMITNGLGTNKFAIIRSVDASTDPALGTAGSVASGTVDFEINNAGAATFSSSVTASSLIKSGGTSAQYLMADGSVSTLTNPVTGTGTTNYIPKFTGASTIGDSLLVDNGTNVYLGNVDGGGKALVINGTGATTATIYFDSTTKTYGLYQTGTQSNLLTGNLGLGVTPSAWNSIYKVAEIGTAAIFGTSSYNSAAFSTNVFYNASNSPRYIANDFANMYWQDDGNHIWYSAPSGTAGDAITFTQAMTLTAGGNLGIGTTGPLGTLDIGKSSATPSLVIGNSSYPSTYNSVWGLQGGAQSIMIFGNNGQNEIRAGSTGAGGYLDFYTNNTAVFTAASNGNFAMRLAANGNVGIGTTAPGQKLQVDGNIYVNDDGTTGNGIMLRGADRPLIARGWDLFTSGNKTGVGRWGVYMESSELFIGAPGTDYSNALITLGGWLVNGTREPNLTLNNSTQRVGIGTTSPQDKLEIKSGYLRMYDPSSSTGAGYFLQWSSDNGGSNVTYAGIDAITTSAGVRTGDLRFSTSSAGAPTEKMRITSAGNVGIGTTAPSKKLQVYGSDNVFEGILVENSNSNAYALYQSKTANSNIWQWGTWNDNSYRTGISGVGDFITITSGGNVGIGTTSPGEKLDVYQSTNGFGGINARNPSAGAAAHSGLAIGNDIGVNSGGIIVFGSAATYSFPYNPNGTYIYSNRAGGVAINSEAAAPLYLATNNTARLYITSAGNVGIGTTSPSKTLHVYTTGNEGIFLQGTGGGVWMDVQCTGSELWSYGCDTGGAGIYNRTDNAYRFYVNNDGNVGIGTTAPVTPLQVVSATNDVDVLRIGNTAGNSGSVQSFTHLAINHFNAGTFPSTRITAYQDGVSGWPGGMYFSTREVNTDSAPLERLRITSAGSIGINTTNPTSRLEVVGDARITTGSLGVGVAPNATDGRIDASNDIVAFSTSDRRLKENITPIANALEKVRSLTGVEFDWKQETKSVHGYEGHDVGVIAQDVQAVLPEAVRTNDSGYLSVRYEKMIALLVEANKELANRVEQLEKLIK